jgi:hypothetical protein
MGIKNVEPARCVDRHDRVQRVRREGHDASVLTRAIPFTAQLPGETPLSVEEREGAEFVVERMDDVSTVDSPMDSHEGRGKIERIVKTTENRCSNNSNLPDFPYFDERFGLLALQGSLAEGGANESECGFDPDSPKRGPKEGTNGSRVFHVVGLPSESKTFSEKEPRGSMRLSGGPVPPSHFDRNGPGPEGPFSSKTSTNEARCCAEIGKLPTTPPTQSRTWIAGRSRLR